MRITAKQYLAYFPILLVLLQVVANLLYFINKDAYSSIGFYLSLMIGSNGLVAIFFLVYTFHFKFCKISRWAAIAECLFAINYLIIQEDNLYNILFQVIVGILAIVLTFNYYLKKLYAND